MVVLLVLNVDGKYLLVHFNICLIYLYLVPYLYRHRHYYLLSLLWLDVDELPYVWLLFLLLLL